MAHKFSLFSYTCRLWFQWSKWTAINALNDLETPNTPQKYVLIVAPHTSNWDFIYGMGTADILKLPYRFTIKKEWMIFPFSGFFRRLGALPIDRTPEKGKPRIKMASHMAQLLLQSDEDLFMVITPEATRSKSTAWKTGFYHTAKEANVPLLLGYLDYEKKQSGIGEVYHLTDDREADMRHIMDFYRRITPKHPRLFSVDEDYS